MSDRHVVIQKHNSKQCYLARRTAGSEDEFWIVATAPNADVARGLVQRLNTASPVVAKAIEGKTAHAAKAAEARAKLRKEQKLTKTQLTALSSLRHGRPMAHEAISGHRALPSLAKRGLVLKLRSGFWRQTRMGREVLEAHEAD